MKNKLLSLLKLQMVDSELDELHELRGDLPQAVSQLETRVNDLSDQIEARDQELKDGQAERKRKELETLELTEKIEKYKGQQLQVKNNKEYDALTNQIELAEQTILQYELDIEGFADVAENIKTVRTELEQEFETLNTELAEKRVALTEIMKSTDEQEQYFFALRAEVRRDISVEDLELYDRVRTAKNGKAVAPIKKGSCSGCYNVVPPQKILEIKKNNQLHICEHCGRILVAEDLGKEIKL